VTGIKLADLLEETASVDVKVGGASVHLVYRVLWDAQIPDDYFESFKDRPIREYFADFLSRLLKSWDLVDEQEQPLPITYEAILSSPMPNRLLQAFADAITGNAVSGKVSSNGSSAT
jgi:hypothetical protein